MMSGCAQNASPKVIDLASVRCPPIAAADAHALAQRPVPPPDGDMTDAKARAWIDAKDQQINGMRLAGRRVTNQYGRCRNGGAGS